MIGERAPDRFVGAGRLAVPTRRDPTGMADACRQGSRQAPVRADRRFVIGAYAHAVKHLPFCSKQDVQTIRSKVLDACLDAPCRGPGYPPAQQCWCRSLRSPTPGFPCASSTESLTVQLSRSRRFSRLWQWECTHSLGSSAASTRAWGARRSASLSDIPVPSRETSNDKSFAPSSDASRVCAAS